MPIVRTSEEGHLLLPADFLNRRHMLPGGEYWLDERHGELILHPPAGLTRANSTWSRRPAATSIAAPAFATYGKIPMPR